MAQEDNEDSLYPTGENGEILGGIKQLRVTRNELLHLSDSVTLLMEHSTDQGKFQVPARQLSPSAGVPVPIELIQIIGMGFVSLADKNNTSDTTILSLTIGDLYLLRECCQSFLKVNDEFVGYNLLLKIYDLILEEAIMERKFINKITAGLDLTLDTRSRLEIMDQLIDKIMKENSDDTAK